MCLPLCLYFGIDEDMIAMALILHILPLLALAQNIFMCFKFVNAFLGNSFQNKTLRDTLEDNLKHLVKHLYKIN